MDQHVKMHVFHKLTLWSVESAVDHNLQVGDVCVCQCWWQVSGDRPGI